VRRTVYAKVSRFKLDDYLQLFDFPSPNLSAEQRFTTTVPLQRLFYMNSDFVQQQAEALAARAGTEANNRARIEKLYQLVFARPQEAVELKAGLEFPARGAASRKAREKKPVAGMEASADGDTAPGSHTGLERRIRICLVTSYCAPVCQPATLVRCRGECNPRNSGINWGP
jgi:hypothetical protein